MLRTHKDDISHMQDFFIMCGRFVEREKEVKQDKWEILLFLGGLFSYPSLVYYLLACLGNGWGISTSRTFFRNPHRHNLMQEQYYSSFLEEFCSCLFIKMVCDSVSLAFLPYSTSQGHTLKPKRSKLGYGLSHLIDTWQIIYLPSLASLFLFSRK